VWASSPAIATKQQNSLIWATVVMDAPDVIAVHIGNVCVAVPGGWSRCVRSLPHPILEFARLEGVAALPALPGVRGRRLG
jgi:hypothetical protein